MTAHKGVPFGEMLHQVHTVHTPYGATAVVITALYLSNGVYTVHRRAVVVSLLLRPAAVQAMWVHTQQSGEGRPHGCGVAQHGCVNTVGVCASVCV
jgi:hypothetical protein